VSDEAGALSSVAKAFRILESFEQDSLTGIGVSALARRAQLPKTTTYRLLQELEAVGAVERLGRVYRIGSVIHGLGAPKDESLHITLREALTPALAQLFERTNQTVHLAVLDGTRVVYLNKLFGPTAIRSPSRLGGQAPAYCTGVGKTLLAFDQKAAELVIHEPLRAWTSRTITDPAQFLDHLAEIREAGISYDREEFMLGLSCVSAPVFDRARRPVAALSVSGASSDFDPDGNGSILRSLAFEASRTLQSSLSQQRRLQGSQRS